MLQWFSPLGMTTTEAVANVRTGGTFRITMQVTPGMETIIPQANGVVVAYGTYEQISEPEFLCFTWSWDGHDEVSRVTVSLADRGSQTELALVHQQITTVESQAFHDDGWALTFDHLDDSLGQLTAS